MADDDPLYPGDTSLLRQWQYPGQSWGLGNPYAGLDPQTDPLYLYTFGPQQPMPDFYDWALSNPEAGPYTQFAGIYPNFDPNLQGNVEFGATLSEQDALMPLLQRDLESQSTGLAPAGGAAGDLPTSPPWIAAQQPGLATEAGFGDIGLGGF